MNRKETVALVATAHGLWPGFDIHEATVPAWMAVLHDVEFDQAEAALKVYAGEGAEFAPPPGVLRGQVMQLTGKWAPDLDEAMREVGEMVRRRGWVHPPEATDWSHPAIHEAVRSMGGWREVCASTNPEAFRAHFRQLYTVARERANRATAAPAEVMAALDRGVAESARELSARFEIERWGTAGS